MCSESVGMIFYRREGQIYLPLCRLRTVWQKLPQTAPSTISSRQSPRQPRPSSSSAWAALAAPSPAAKQSGRLPRHTASRSRSSSRRWGSRNNPRISPFVSLKETDHLPNFTGRRSSPHAEVILCPYRSHGNREPYRIMLFPVQFRSAQNYRYFASSFSYVLKTQNERINEP